MGIKKRVIVVIMIVFGLAGGIMSLALADNGNPFTALVKQWLGQTTAEVSVPKELSKILEAYQIIKSSYLGEVDTSKLIDGAIAGMLESLEDPYSVYMDPETAGQFNESFESSFEGIGAQVTMKNGRVTIVSPFKGSPSQKAGLKPNDQIISIDGESIEGMDLHEAVKKMRGPKGTKVKLGVARPGVKETLTIVVTRDTIPLKTVYAETVEHEGKTFGRLEITQFSLGTADEFREALQELTAKPVDGLVIDVRGNPGGILTSVVEIVDELLPQGKKITTIEYSTGEKQEFITEKNGVRLPMVVLTDEGSASASEILAAALKENGYKTIGKKTFGKGTVQHSVEMSDKSQIKITVAKWLTPSGQWIHEKGVLPSIDVDQPPYFKVTPFTMEQTLIRDMTGADVKNLQMMLKGLGFNPGREDGYFSEQTETAVKAFQNLNKLPVTGKVDQATANKLQDAVLEKIEDPENDLQLKVALQYLAKETN